MQGYQCKCGKIVGSNSGYGFRDCEGCTECNTTFSHSPDGHRELKPHVFVDRYNQTTGKPYNICKECGHIDKESYKLSSIAD